jgi:amidase
VARPDDVERITWLWVQRCPQRSGQQMAEAIGTLHAVARAMGRFFEHHDVLLTPTCATPPLQLQQVHMRSADLDDYCARLYANDTFTTLYNCTGLPVGVQLAAPLGHDLRLLQLAAQLEQARPWADRRPPGFSDRVVDP